MLAQINPWVFHSFLGAFVVANLAAYVAVIGCFATRRRRTWLAVLATVAILLGSWPAWIRIAQMPNATPLWTWLSVAPPILGIISLIHWKFFTHEHPPA